MLIKYWQFIQTTQIIRQYDSIYTHSLAVVCKQSVYLWHWLPFYQWSWFVKSLREYMVLYSPVYMYINVLEKLMCDLKVLRIRPLSTCWGHIVHIHVSVQGHCRITRNLTNHVNMIVFFNSFIAAMFICNMFLTKMNDYLKIWGLTPIF